ncbi:hypothetical protein ACJIZ3_004126 [Penstemon smallii]|uniref:Agenet domain-containing protein n=1 Tax=Penstemon smallii TaxID=265156 RepID=A0ABD3S165_9LAMI
MDNNDNDYEGHNFQLAGEESSKLSSVLRPFALPKFDFDDSLHGHLRFDSLVENEVFLGIPSQDDNQWIEDFSRGSSGIGFSSSATESCALPTRNNVWSEATSSESVEMLLKAVGQEEMLPGERMIEESDPGDKPGSSMRQMESNLSQDDNIDGVDCVNPSIELDPGDQSGSPFRQMESKHDVKINDVDRVYPSLPHAEVDGNFSRLNQSEGAEGFCTENTSQTQERSISSYEVYVNDKESSIIMTSECLNIDMTSTSGDRGETCELLSDSLSEQFQENIHVHDMDISNQESSSQKITPSVGDSGDQDKVRDISSSCISEGITEGIKEQEVLNTNDERLVENTVETVSSEMHCSLEIPSEIESKEELAVDIHMHNWGEIVCMPEKADSVSTVDRCSEVAFIVEPAADSESGTVVFSSATGISQPSEGYNKLHDKSSVSFEGGHIEGFGIRGSDAVNPTSCNNAELNKVPGTQPLDQPKSIVGDEDVCPGSKSSLDASGATFESSILAETLGSPSDRDIDSNHADFPSNSIDSSFTGEYCEEESVIEDMKDVRGAALIQNENLEDGDRVSPPLMAGSTQTCGEDIPPIQTDHQGGLDVSDCEKEDNNLPLGSKNMVSDNNESPGEGVELNAERATGSLFNTFARDYQVLNTEVEDSKLAASCDEGDEIADMGYTDQNKETELEAEPNTSTPMKSFKGAAEVASAIDIDKGTQLDYAATEGSKMGDPSVSSVETSNATMPYEAIKTSNEKIKDPATDLIVQNDDSEAAPTEKAMEAVTEQCSGRNSSIVLVSSCPVEFDVSDKLSAPVVNCNDHPQSQLNNQDNNVEDVGDVLSTSMNSEANAISKEEGTFTFDIKPLGGGQSIADSDEGLQSLPRIQACKLSLTQEGSPSVPSSSQKDMMIVKEISHGSSLSLSTGVQSSGGVKIPSERKARRGSGKYGNVSAKKGNLLKGTTPLQQKDSGDKSSLSPQGAGQLMTVEHAVKPRGAVSIPTSSLPDLNTSAPSSAVFQQPFMDLQQVQLRAQIFVYGSLIQGAAPDEAYMVSAFGKSDGGRSIWEPSWRACVERLHGQKKKGNNTETPIQSRSGSKAPDQTSRQGSSQSEDLFSPAGRASNKAIPYPLSPIIHLSSPLWNITTPSCEGPPSSSMSRCAIFDYQAISPLHPYQTPVGNFVAHTTSKSTQARFPVPWIASSQGSPFDIGAKYSAFPNTEPVKLTPVKESSLAITSGSKHGSLVPSIHSGATTMSAGTSSLLDLKKVTVSTGQTPIDTKSRKRKKTSGVENIQASASLAVSAVQDLGQISLNSQNQDSIYTPVLSCHNSTSVAVTTPGLVPKGTFNQFSSAVSPSVSNEHIKRDDVILYKRSLDLETLSKVEEAKLHAEEAAAQAATAVSHCQVVWSQLNQQKNSGLTSDAEAKLASAAVAIAAAASVAKAAAAAAKIASSVSVQAKQMADDAVTMHRTVFTTEHNTTLTSNLVNNTGVTSPVSILQGGNLGISSAREAARKRIEAASAATKHAENLDAIVKAAELAAEAVSHTGTIVGMGDPFSLTQLVEAGPDAYWKASHDTSVHGLKTNDTNKNKSTYGNVGELPTVYPNLHEGPDIDVFPTGQAVPPTQRQVSRNTVGELVVAKENPITSVKHGVKNLKPQKDKRPTDSAKAVGFVSEPDIGSMSISSFANLNGSTSIEEGSIVEVRKDGGDSKKAWFSANLQSLKDGEALVCYRELQSDEGSEQLKEWISLEPQGGKAPIIRIPHPMNAVQFDGTRKRRRAAAKDYAWSVGDKVDAWVQDRWREGIIAEKNKKDTTTLTVHFPAQGEMLTVKVWHLRPTVIWSDGQWIEWRRSEQDGTSQGDTPKEKRTKLESVSIETTGKGKMAKNIDFAEERGTEEPTLPLSANEKVFSIGSMRDEKKPIMARTMRSGLQKEGSRVVFGVPKPGKKRKFMDVSKHYVSDRTTKTNNNVPNDSVKKAKYLMPQGSGSRGLKSNSKVDLKEKLVAEPKPKTLKSGKPPIIPTRKLPRKDDSSSSQSGEPNLAEFGSSSDVEETSKGTVVFSSHALPPESREASIRNNTTPERLNKGKLAPGGWKSAKIESNQALILEVTEPRRSIRRTQPTSRLLEGLQSSLMVSKKDNSRG